LENEKARIVLKSLIKGGIADCLLLFREEIERKRVFWLEIEEKHDVHFPIHEVRSGHE